MDDWILLTAGLALLLATLLALLTYSGIFACVDVKTGTPPIGKVTIAYKDGTGAYSNVGSIFTESTSIAPGLKQIGMYYDDPAKVPEEKCRWAVGAILAENDENVDETVHAAYEKEKYKFISLPAVPTSVNCVFPYSTMISIFIAVKRVYPKLGDYIKEYSLEAYPMIEVYFGGNIHFMAPLSNQMQFYTPKALELEEAEEVSRSETQEVSPPETQEVLPPETKEVSPPETQEVSAPDTKVSHPETEEVPIKTEEKAASEEEDSVETNDDSDDGSFEKVEAEI